MAEAGGKSCWGVRSGYWPSASSSSSESRPVGLRPLMAGEPGRACDKSSKPGLSEGETVAGLVSHEPVLCSDVAMVVVVLGGTRSSSSSSRKLASRMSVGRDQVCLGAGGAEAPRRQTPYLQYLRLNASGCCLLSFPFSVLEEGKWGA